MGHETPQNSEQQRGLRYALHELARIATLRGFMPEHADPALSEHIVKQNEQKPVLTVVGQ